MAFHLTIPKSPTAAEIQEMADRLQSSSAQVVVVFATEGQLLDLLLEVNTQYMPRHKILEIKLGISGSHHQFYLCTFPAC